MRVERAKTAGFCMGVGLALKKLHAALNERPAQRIRTLGPIIHNPQVLAYFEDRGVVCLNDVAEAQKGDHVLIRAHGIPRRQEEKLRQLCHSVADATCPKVKKAQLAISQATENGQTLLLFGEAAHPEVAGLVSYANGKAHVFGSEMELGEMRFDPAPGLVLASQTTQDRGAFERIARSLTRYYPEMKILSTICDATRERQEEALAIAARVDAMIVVGGRTSGNTRRLASLASGAGIPTFHVETLEELKSRDFSSYASIGLTAGASTPSDLIDEVYRWLADISNRGN